MTSGASLEEVESRIREAVALHVESLRAHGEPVPQPTTPAVRVVEVT